MTELSDKGNLFCSAISVLEVQAGVRRGEEDRTNAFLEGFAVCAVDREVTNRAGAYLREYRGRGITLDFAASIIASTAVGGALMLVTENAAHFPMPEVRLIAPRDQAWSDLS